MILEGIEGSSVTFGVTFTLLSHLIITTVVDTPTE